jgi:RNA polymerase sigma factor (TIGR02999 family)
MDVHSGTSNGNGVVEPAQHVLLNATPRERSNEELLATLYEELRQLAAAKLAREKPQTLQATALVHEAWLKLGGQRFENRAHFFGAAAEAMRRILVERARSRARLKRGGDLERAEFAESEIASPLKDDKLLLVHEVLDALAARDPLKAEIVKLRYFAGLENAEIGALLGVNEKTVRRHWQVAKIQLFQMISEE